MGTKIYGIFAAQNKDRVGETILLKGMDTSNLSFIDDEHDSSNFLHIIGNVSSSKKIFKEADCENERQRRCWEHAKVPFLYGEAELLDAEDHPDAIAAKACLMYAHRNPDSKLRPGFSIEGREILKDPKTKEIAKSEALGAALTLFPCNPKCAAFLFDEPLAKSFCPEPNLSRYKGMRKNFSMSLDAEIDYRMKTLVKSLQNITTTVKCKHCGDQTVFTLEKSWTLCPECRKPFDMQQIAKIISES